jgi:hypothetical protein
VSMMVKPTEEAEAELKQDFHAQDRRGGAGWLVRGPLLRYIVFALLASVIAISTLTYLASVIVKEWSRRDISLRSRLVFRSVQGQVAMAITSRPQIDLTSVFEQITEDDRILALGFCTSIGQLRFATKDFPKSITCDSIKSGTSGSLITATDAGRQIPVSSFPITAEGSTGRLLVLHDLSYIDERTRSPCLYTACAHRGDLQPGPARHRDHICDYPLVGPVNPRSHHRSATGCASDHIETRRLPHQPRGPCRTRGTPLGAPLRERNSCGMVTRDTAPCDRRGIAFGADYRRLQSRTLYP